MQPAIRLLHLTAALLAGAASVAPAVAQCHSIRLSVSAEIDGRSRLELRGDTARWVMVDGTAPGRFGCEEFGFAPRPTHLGPVVWYPTWWCDRPPDNDCEPDTLLCPVFPEWCVSDPLVGYPEPLPPFAYGVRLDDVIMGPGPVTIHERPSASNGYRVTIEFDDRAYSGSNWYMIELILGPYPDLGVTRHCLATANSTGRPGRIDVTGWCSVSADNTRLLAEHCPPGHAGVFLCGELPAWIPLASGTLCISPFWPGIRRVHAPVLIRVDGTADLALDLASLGPDLVITGGSTWHFQFWFRDRPPGGVGTNLTDAIGVRFRD